MSEKSFRKNIHLTFPPKISGSPCVCNLTRQFDLTFNILKAQITPRRDGFLTLELSGTEENCLKGIAYLREHDITVADVSQHISRDEDSCTHCGTCTSICPADALHMDWEKRNVVFDTALCTGCGMCTRVCPVGAMHIETEQNIWA